MHTLNKEYDQFNYLTTKEGRPAIKNSRTISNKSNLKGTKMAKATTKNRIKKMTFQTQTRKHAPLSENDKYLIEELGYRKQEVRGHRYDENISRIARRSVRP